jgi:aspartyl-tRNA(Asn)/glutamyl-tRNA(Gln) amidotransferase subunit B
MRGKEELHDYRYFPEPDLPDLVVPAETVSRMADGMPELPWQKQERFAREYALSPYDAEVLSASRATADYYEAVARISGNPRAAANWVMREALSVANTKGVGLGELGVEPARLAELMELVAAGKLSHNLGADVLSLMAETGQPAALIVEERDLGKIEADDQLDAWVAETLAENLEEVERFRAGEEKLLTFFIGQVMRKSRGRADAKQLRQRLLAALEPGEAGDAG